MYTFSLYYIGLSFQWFSFCKYTNVFYKDEKLHLVFLFVWNKKKKNINGDMERNDLNKRKRLSTFALLYLPVQTSTFIIKIGVTHTAPEV